MNTEYDVIVLGTGLKECMLAGLLAKFPKKTEGEQKEGAKILQLDRNGYYGSDSASLNLTNLWKHFRRNISDQVKKFQKNMVKIEIGMLILFQNILWLMVH